MGLRASRVMHENPFSCLFSWYISWGCVELQDSEYESVSVTLPHGSVSCHLLSRCRPCSKWRHMSVDFSDSGILLKLYRNCKDPEHLWAWVCLGGAGGIGSDARRGEHRFQPPCRQVGSSS